MTAASINEFKTLVQKLDSSFSTDKTDKNEIVAAYREHYETSTHDTIMKSIETQAKEAMLTLVLEKAAASFNDEHYPSRAVDDTYDEKLNNYKYAYKSLSDTDAAKYATLEEYIIYKENAADYADAEASMLADSKRIVLEKMVVIHTANLYGIEVTKDDYEAKREEIINSMYIYLMLGMSEDDIIAVLPHETERLVIKPEKDLITLITCVPYGVNTHRLLVTGTRVEDTKETMVAEDTTETTSIIPETLSVRTTNYIKGILIGLFCAVTIICVVAIITILWRNRKRNDENPEESPAEISDAVFAPNVRVNLP